MLQISVKEILAKIDFKKFVGNTFFIVNEVVAINSSTNKTNFLCWCKDTNKDVLNHVENGLVIVSENVNPLDYNNNCSFIIVENPRKIFMDILYLFFVEKMEFSISKSAVIDASLKLNDKICIGNNVVIEQNCKIGINVIIGHNSVVLKDTVIGDNVKIGSNCTIGGVGFGYEKDDEGNYEFIPHLGNVVLKNNVEIGNNTAIDRAVLGSTILNENVKVDNLVHIAHGVFIGRNSLIIANSMIAGSAIIGENVWIAPSASIINKKKIGNNSVVGMGAVVLKDVDNNAVIVGNPGRKLNK